MSIAISWGVDAAEAAETHPCDRFLPDPAETWFRAVTVHAPAPVVYRWLCQLRVAPYSYDLIDNYGRRSPRTLTPGLEHLAVGQRFAKIFQLVDFTPDRQITLEITDRVALAAFGPVVITYAVSGLPSGDSRLIAKLCVGRRGDGPVNYVRRRVLAWGDLVMMHRQLTVLRDLAEARGTAPSP